MPRLTPSPFFNFSLARLSRLARNDCVTLLRLLLGTACCAACAGSTYGEPKKPSRHVVLVIWDGMRPDFLSETHTPTLWKFAQEGVTFLQHHSVYPTATQVNGTAIATGVYPARSGLMANREYRPAIRVEGPVDTAVEEVVRRGDEISGGKYLTQPTVAEMVRAAGGTAVVAGSKSIAMLHDRKSEWTIARRTQLTTAFAGAPLPERRRDELEKLLGPFRIRPTDTNDDRNAFTTGALTRFLWRDGIPDYSVLWLSDPDLTQHDTAPGSPEALAAIKNIDRNLATVLQALEKKSVRRHANVLVVSDHGFSTINRAVDVPDVLRKAGFDAPDRFTETPKTGQVMVVGNGGSTLFYVVDREQQTIRRLVEMLQRSDFAGVIFAREKIEGTFDLQTARLDTAEPPDVVVAMRWTAAKNRFGIAGELVADATRAVGKGTHASLSAYDVHNTLIAAGPDFQRNLQTQPPSGNVDIAPTVLHLLGLRPPEKLDGRVLTEALTGVANESPVMRSETIEARRELGEGEWRQYLKLSRIREATYIDEGNGEFGSAKR